MVFLSLNSAWSTPRLEDATPESMHINIIFCYPYTNLGQRRYTPIPSSMSLESTLLLTRPLDMMRMLRREDKLNSRPTETLGREKDDDLVGWSGYLVPRHPNLVCLDMPMLFVHPHQISTHSPNKRHVKL